MSAHADNWRHTAACLHAEPELFYPVSGDRMTERLALAYCHHCPVVSQCLEAALAEPEQYGVWGGMTADERRQLKRSRMRASRIRAFEQRRRARVSDAVLSAGSRVSIWSR